MKILLRIIYHLYLYVEEEQQHNKSSLLIALKSVETLLTPTVPYLDCDLSLLFFTHLTQ